MNYHFGRNAQGKLAQKTLTIGPYPAVSLKDARDARDLAKSMLTRGIEPKPSDLFDRSSAEDDVRPTFKNIAMAWHKLQMRRWSKVHAKDVLDCLENLVFPAIGSHPIEDSRFMRMPTVSMRRKLRSTSAWCAPWCQNGRAACAIESPAASRRMRI
jgi:hypothetical protein